jgi:hypothetical protein
MVWSREVTMPKHRTLLSMALVLLCAGAAVAAPPANAPAHGRRKDDRAERAARPKYYFKIVEVNVGKNDPEVGKLARDLLEKDLSSRPEFTSDLGGAEDPAAVMEQLKQRGLKGFQVSLRIDRLKKELMDPKPGARLKQLEVDVKLSVFGTTFPGEKLAFSGEGEAVAQAEIVEQRQEQEALTLIKDGMPGALKQALDQMVAKLSMPKSAPMNESKRKRKPS